MICADCGFPIDSQDEMHGEFFIGIDGPMHLDCGEDWRKGMSQGEIDRAEFEEALRKGAYDE